MKTNTAKNLPLRVLKQIILILFALIVLYPIFFVFITSFKSNFDVISNPFGMSTFQPENYIEAWQVGKIGDYFLNSVYVTAITLIIQMVVIVLASYSFAKLKPWGHKVLFILFLTGLFITTEMVTVPNFSTMKNLGLMDTKISLILPYVSTGIALATYIATNYISSLPKELDEAAIIDGCNIVHLLTKIALPLMRPILATIFIFNCMERILLGVDHDSFGRKQDPSARPDEFPVSVQYGLRCSDCRPCHRHSADPDHLSEVLLPVYRRHDGRRCKRLTESYRGADAPHS